jgi:hypothetical protein
VTRLWVRKPRKNSSIPARGKRFSSSPSVQAPSGVHPASCSMGTGCCSPSVKLEYHLCLVLMSILSTTVPPCLWRPSCHMQGQLIFTASYCQHNIKMNWWHQHGPFSTSQHISEDSNQHTAHGMQVPTVCICIFLKFWRLQWVGYIYGRRFNTCIENLGRESSHLERDFMAGARLPTVGLCYLCSKLYNQRDEVSYYIQQHKSSCSWIFGI